MERRVDATGNTSYEEPCPGKPGCTMYYWSVMSGCDYDYDTRAFTNELGYSALLFDHFHSPKYDDVMRFTLALEHAGTFADKWDFWPPPDDPYYVWTAADTSVVNISVNFWSLAAALPGRPEARPGSIAWGGGDGADPAPGALGRRPVSLGAARASGGAGGNGGAGATAPRPASIATPGLLSATPNPSRDAFAIRFTSVGSEAVSIAIFDAAGRRVRALCDRPFGLGAHEALWDGRDDAGAECRSGLYFASLRSGAEARAIRLLRIR
jgi:hypothetical protein